MWKIIPTKKTVTPTELAQLAHLQKILADMGKNGAANEDIRNINVQITEITGESRLSLFWWIFAGIAVFTLLVWGLYPAIESAKSFFGQTVPLREYKALENELKKQQKIHVDIGFLESANKLLTEEKRRNECVIRGYNIILTLTKKNGGVMPPQATGIGEAELRKQCRNAKDPDPLFM